MDAVYDAVGVMKEAARDGAVTHCNHISRDSHLVIDHLQSFSHLVGDGAFDTIRSDCRREPKGRTPNLSRSCLAPLAAPNSALQHAVVMLTGQSEYMRPQFITWRIGVRSTIVWTMSPSFPIQTLIPSASIAIGSSSGCCRPFWEADMVLPYP